MSDKLNAITDLQIKPSEIHLNLGTEQLYEEALRRGEGQIAKHGPLLVKTGEHTGRSAKDKFITRDSTTENSIWWENSASISSEQFGLL